MDCGDYLKFRGKNYWFDTSFENKDDAKRYAEKKRSEFLVHIEKAFIPGKGRVRSLDGKDHTYYEIWISKKVTTRRRV